MYLDLVICFCFIHYSAAMNPTTSDQIATLIAQTKGKFFSLTFVKKDGSKRVVNGKNSYERLLRGGNDTVRAAGYVPFVDRNKGNWICAHDNSLVSFRCGKIVQDIV